MKDYGPPLAAYRETVTDRSSSKIANLIQAYGAGKLGGESLPDATRGPLATVVKLD